MLPPVRRGAQTGNDCRDTGALPRPVSACAATPSPPPAVVAFFPINARADARFCFPYRFFARGQGVKLRAFATVCSIAVIGLLGGCAGTPSRDNAYWDSGDRPQTVIPGAVRSDVKGLAMGAARSKGWAIVRSSDELVVMQRPLDPASPSAAALGASGSVIPPMIEVTSAFVEQPDGVKVALGAELVTQAPGEKAPKRTDYTETYRDALNLSLESLRANWDANRQRLATAIPPLPDKSEGAPPPGSTAAGNPLTQTWAEAAAADDATQPAPASEPAEPTRPVAPPVAPETRVQPPPAVESATRPPTQPTAPRTASGPAPVVDGSRTLSERQGVAPAPPPATSLPPMLPPAEPEQVPPGENMLTLSEASGTGTWAYYAEQYARLRGCNVTDQGAQLIESRADGEIHKVACSGADSFLLKCQNGVCRGLE